LVAIIVSSYKAVQVKDIQKPMFLASKTKVLIFKCCPGISVKCEGLFWCLDHTGSWPGRQTGSSHENTISAFTVSLSPLSKANTHPSKLRTHFLQRQTHIAQNTSFHHTWCLTPYLQFEAKKCHTWKCIELQQKLSRDKTVYKIYTL